MKTDTPRTDAIQFQKKPISLSIENEMLRSLSRQLERELAASQAKVERLNSELSDMECEVWPEMARLKAEVAFWKAKAYEAEQSEGKHEAEVERLTELLSLEERQHEETRQLCAKILDSTRKTPSLEWHRKNNKVLLK